MVVKKQKKGSRGQIPSPILGIISTFPYILTSIPVFDIPVDIQENLFLLYLRRIRGELYRAGCMTDVPSQAARHPETTETVNGIRNLAELSPRRSTYRCGSCFVKM